LTCCQGLSRKNRCLNEKDEAAFYYGRKIQIGAVLGISTILRLYRDKAGFSIVKVEKQGAFLLLPSLELKEKPEWRYENYGCALTTIYMISAQVFKFKRLVSHQKQQYHWNKTWFKFGLFYFSSRFWEDSFWLISGESYQPSKKVLFASLSSLFVILSKIKRKDIISWHFNKVFGRWKTIFLIITRKISLSLNHPSQLKWI